MQITKQTNKLVPEMITIACQFGQTHSGWVWIAADRVSAFFWLGPVHCSQNPQIRKKCKTNFKTKSHGTIHTFKNYFVTAFLIFNNK